MLQDVSLGDTCKIKYYKWELIMKNWIFRFIILVILVLISPSQNLYAQQRVVVEGDKLPELTDQMKNEIVDSIAVLMSNNYVYPEIGKQIADYLKKQLKNKQYIEFKDVTEFSQKLSEDILSINNDRHLGVRFDPEMERMLNNVNPDEENDSLLFRITPSPTTMPAGTAEQSSLA